MQSEFEDEWRERFEEFASLRDDDAGIAGWSATGLAARIRCFRAHWTPAHLGALWLDAGCGAGTYARTLIESGQRVVGLDYSLPTLRKAVARELPGVSFVVADVRRLPFENERFDGVLCFGVTQALAESRRAIDALASTLKPEGELWIDALNGWCVLHLWGTVRRRLQGRRRHLRYESPRRMKKQMRECGLVDVQIHWMPIAPERAPLLQRLAESAPMTWVLRSLPLVGMLFAHAFILQGKKTKGRVARACPAVKGNSA